MRLDSERTESLREDTRYFEMVTAVREALHGGNPGADGIATAGLGTASIAVRTPVRGAETR